MPITQSICTSSKVALLNGDIDFSADTTDVFRLALYTTDATLNASTNAYTAANEVSGAGYTAGGNVVNIAQNPQLLNTTAAIDLADVSWTGASFTARGGLLYKVGGSNQAIGVLDFGGDITVVSSTFIVQFPAFGESTAIIRIL